MKKVLLIILTAVVYLVSLKISVEAASSSPYDVPTYSRDYHQGYFSDSNDTDGDFVLQNDANDGYSHTTSGGGYDAIPPSVNTASEFITYILTRLNSNRVDPGTANNAKNWDRTGAAFIIQTMIGTSRSRPPTAAQIQDWKDRVNHAASIPGHINWGLSVTAAPNTYYQINRNDGSSSVNDVAWYSSSGSGNAIVFYHDNGTVAYRLRRQCANPLGQLSALSPATVPYTISATSAVNDTTAVPGQVIQFTHTISSSASTSGAGISWTTQNMPAATAVASGTTAAFGGAGSVGVGTENYTVPMGTAAGTTICRRVTYSPASNAGGSGASAQACSTVQYAYDLNPTVTVSATNAQDGDTVTFTYRVQNTGGNASVAATCTARDGGGVVQATPLTCSGGQSFPYNSGVVTVGTQNVTISGLTAGTLVCRTLTIAPATPSVATRTSSPPTCVVVSKVPYVRFGGNDVWAGGGFPAVTPACNISAKITTSGRALPSTVPTQYAGSSVEYSAYALNRITSFGSAGKVLVGSGALGDLSRMFTFANNEANVSLLGYYGASQHCLQDYSSLYSTAPTAGLPSINAATSGAWRSTTSLALNAGPGAITMPSGAGNTKVYYVQGDVTLNGNVTYPASYANYGSIPSLLIIATGNIYVGPGVTQLDGQYVARGTFYTCYPKPVPNTATTCNTQLTVNGSVIAGGLDLYRTFGADGGTVASKQTPAEVFNFAPEVYLRNALLQTAKPSMQVLNSIELPPRF